jgi:3-hydroxybutyryl-CoA dehydrogenase
MHFFNPVHLMRLVEVVVHPGTAEGAREEALAIVHAMGKEPIVVNDSPGFASSRLGVVLGLEAMRMLEQGVASATDIDRAMALGYNHPMGPLRLTDLVGLDVRLKIAEHLYHTLGGDQYAPPDILRRLVAEGKLGRKAGYGFYDWKDA